MTGRQKCTLADGDSSVKLSYLFLLLAGAIEFLYTTTYFLCIDGFFFINDYFAENYLILPCVLFLGAALTHPLSLQSKRRLLLGFAVVSWFMIIQIWHGANDYGTFPLSHFFLLYLLAFPFATVNRDGEKNIGLILIGLVYIAAGLVLVGYTGLLYLERLPAIMRAYIYWDGARLSNVWHPNITAVVFLVGVGLSAAFFLLAKKRWQKIGFLLTAAALFVCLTLTNSRTSILMSCAMVGGIAFFALIQKGGWKRWLAGIAVALVIAGGLYAVSQTVYQVHTDHRIQKISAHKETEETAAAETADEESGSKEQVVGTLEIDEITGETKLVSNSSQGSLQSDFWTLNGRTGIWKAALRGVAADPVMLFLGTKDVTGIVAANGSFAAAHAHNSLIQILMNVGLFGLLFALVYTFLTLRSVFFLLFGKGAELWQKVIAMLVLCMFMAGMLEFYLFIPDYAHFLAFPYHLLSGYLVHWRDQLRKA